jgi:hypothetical protein
MASIPSIGTDLSRILVSAVLPSAVRFDNDSVASVPKPIEHLSRAFACRGSGLK